MVMMEANCEVRALEHFFHHSFWIRTLSIFYSELFALFLPGIYLLGVSFSKFSSHCALSS